jgi:hypothetical protein
MRSSSNDNETVVRQTRRARLAANHNETVVAGYQQESGRQ